MADFLALLAAGGLVEKRAEFDLFVGALEVRSTDEKARTCDFVASTDAIDSYDEIIEQDWVLGRFLSNPVALYAHNSRELPIGQCTRCEVVTTDTGRRQLECTILFSKATQRAEEVWQQVLERTLRAVSVGFMPGDYRLEMRDGADVWVLSKNVLHEISVVPIPANPEALAKMRAHARAAHRSADPSRAENTSMTLQELQALLAQRDAEIAQRDAEMTTVRAAGDTLSARATAAEARATDLDAQVTVTRTALGAAAEETLLEAAKRVAADVAAKQLALDEAALDALVGTKILPAEKEGLLELAALSRPIFNKQVAAAKARPDLKILGHVIPADPKPENTEAGGGDQNGKGLADLVKSAAPVATADLTSLV